jgi:hypothetical protein
MLKPLNNVDQKIKTDHKYTLSLTLGRRDTGPLPDQEIQRFRVSQLSKPDQRDAVVALVSRTSTPFAACDDIDQKYASRLISVGADCTLQNNLVNKQLPAHYARCPGTLLEIRTLSYIPH